MKITNYLLDHVEWVVSGMSVFFLAVTILWLKWMDREPMENVATVEESRLFTGKDGYEGEYIRDSVRRHSTDRVDVPISDSWRRHSPDQIDFHTFLHKEPKKLLFLYSLRNPFLNILKNEVDGDTSSALQKMGSNYTMTWMYKSGNRLFPTTSPDVAKEAKDVYLIKDRRYEIKNIAEGDSVVMVELIESYPDKKDGKEFRTPLVLVLEIENDKIARGRHYCDPSVSFSKVSQETVENAYTNTTTKLVIG